MFPSTSIVFDLEIISAIPDKVAPKIPGITYCRHWGDHAAMGISVLCTASPDGSNLRTFIGDPRTPGLGEPLMEFYQLALRADLIIGYGSRTFDAKVLAARGINLPEGRHFDILKEVKTAIKNQAPKGWKLSDASGRIGYPSKDFNGALAPILWQQGHYQEVIEYCQTDVMRTCALAQHYAANGCSLPAPEMSRVQLRTIAQILTIP